MGALVLAVGHLQRVFATQERTQFVCCFSAAHHREAFDYLDFDVVR
jgi:hypothetical protein